MLELITGNPSDDRPASFSKFVLPFAYQLEPIEYKKAPEQYYEELKEDVKWRRRYFTHETANALYDRARRFRLKGVNRDQRFKFNFSGDEEIEAFVSLPEIVLFECPKDFVNLEKDILQTGFLVVELHFPNVSKNGRPNLDDLLKLNELFRYWQRPYEGHEDCGYKCFLHDQIKHCVDPLKIYFDRWAKYLDAPIKITENKFVKLFPSEWADNARKSVSDEPKQGQDEGWAVYADNRTFVWTCALINDGFKTLSDCFYGTRPWDFGHWIKLLNIDSPGESLIASNDKTNFEKKWAKERTYTRWEEEGTLHGFTYHSGAMLAPSSKAPPLWKHFREMYFDEVLLLFYLRVTLFRFSRELGKLSATARDINDKNKKNWATKYDKIKWAFTLFTNFYQFPLLSNQQQAVEMYEIMRKSMDVDALFNEVQQEVHNSHDYLTGKGAQEQNQRIERLTVVASVGLAFSLVLGFMGADVIVGTASVGLKNKFDCWFGDKYGLIVLILSAFLFFVLIMGGAFVFSKRLAEIFDWLTKLPDRGCKSLRNYFNSRKRS